MTPCLFCVLARARTRALQNAVGRLREKFFTHKMQEMQKGEMHET